MPDTAQSALRERLARVSSVWVLPDWEWYSRAIMESLFTAAFFAANRARLRKLVGDDLIVLTANGLMQRSQDTTFPFRQDSNFWYLTGIDEPDLVLVMDGDKEYLIVPDRDAVRSVFDGVLDNKRLSVCSGIKRVMPAKAGWQQLNKRLRLVKQVATLAAPPAYVERLDFYSNPARAALAQKLTAVNPQLKLLDLRDHLKHLRMIKQPAELKALQRAIDLTVTGFQTIQSQLASLSHEYQVEAALTHHFRSQGSDHGYEPIVAGGLRACTLHYVTNSAALDSSELLLIDVGAEVEHYTADITRTWPLKRPTKRQVAVLTATQAVQDYALGLLKPGVELKAYEKQVSEFMGQQLRELGLIKVADKRSIRRYFPHATSHFLGLDAHDVGDYEAPLQANTVLTVEPGIYIPEEGIGVRIEDDVLITKTGHRVLSAGLPTQL